MGFLSLVVSDWLGFAEIYALFWIPLLLQLSSFIVYFVDGGQSICFYAKRIVEVVLLGWLEGSGLAIVILVLTKYLA